jgi:NhaP-type Na+/H+ or K+/H+ antiporter
MRTGIMAIFVGGVIMSHYTQWNLSDEARMVTASLFKTLAFAAETFLFAYIGLSAVTFSYDNAVGLAMGAFVLCLIGRALNILPLSLIVNQFRTKKISMKVSRILSPLPSPRLHKLLTALAAVLRLWRASSHGCDAPNSAWHMIGPVGQSWPRGTGSVGRGAQGQ